MAGAPDAGAPGVCAPGDGGRTLPAGLVVPPDDGTIFLSELGDPMKLPRLTQLMRRHVEAADLGKSGACHIFRHSMATAMLEGGCDIRLLQEILGHADTSTTALYTWISIKRLKKVHDDTHPAAHLDPKKPALPARDEGPQPTEEDVLAALEAEGAEDDAVEVGDDER